MPSTDVETVFKCPVCGSPFFTSYGTTEHGLLGPPDTLRGRCKGPAAPGSYLGGKKMGYAGCWFSWPRTEDEKYFTPKK